MHGKGKNGVVRDALVVFAFAADALAVLDQDTMSREVFLVATLATTILEREFHAFVLVQQLGVFATHIAFGFLGVQLVGIVKDKVVQDSHVCSF